MSEPGKRVLGDILDGANKRAIEKLRTCFPARVVSFDAATQTCAVQPAIRGRRVDLDGTIIYYDAAQVVNVPVVFPQTQQFGLFFPLAPGDWVLIVCAERSIAEWMTVGHDKVESKETRKHSVTDAIAIPGIQPNPNKVDNVPTDRISIRQAQRSGSPLEPARVDVTTDGKVVIGNGTVELLDLLHQLLDALKTSYVPTAIGPQPILYNAGANNIPAQATTLDGLLSQIKE